MESEQPYESLYDQARRTTRQPTGRDLASRASDAVTVVGGAVVGAIGHRTNRCGACGVTACVLGLAAAVAFGGVAVFEAAARPTAPPPGAVCADRESCLQIVDSFLRRQPRQTFWDDGVGLMQTFGPDSVSGGPCGDQMCKLVEPCPNYQQTPHCRYDVYDNALAAIYLSKRGKLDEARGLLDAFIKLLYPGWAVPGLEIGGLPSNRSVTLLAASYTDAAAQAGAYQGTGVADGAVDTGNNAWVGLAFAHYAAASGDACYALVAHDILRALARSEGCSDSLGGFSSRLKPYPAYYRSTEHNTDMYALATILGDADAAARARRFVSGMYGQQTKGSEVKQRGDTYATGTGGAKACDATIPFAPVAADAQFWSLLAGADPQYDRKATALAFATAEPKEDATGDASQLGLWTVDVDRIGNPSTGGGKGERREGVRFTSWGNGAQWENSASAAMGLAHFGSLYPNASKELGAVVTRRLNASRAALRGLLAAYGFVPASILGGNINAWIKNDHAAEYPGGSDTGIGWTYLRYPHVASSVWTGLLLLHQADDDEKLDPHANPFAPPEGKIASAAEAATSQQCIKPGKPGDSPPPGGGGGGGGGSTGGGGGGGGGGGAGCAAHPKCAGLAGDCCPTDTGINLGCC